MEKRMKKLLVAATVAGFVGTVNAQSAFEGFYGQIGVGYESNQPKTSFVANDLGATTVTYGDSNSNGFSGAIGLGYTAAVSKDFLITVGADYSPLSNTGNSNWSAGGDSFTNQYKFSNRTNIFLAPGFMIDKDKQLYVKAGYSMLNVKTSGQIAGDGGNPSANLNGYVAGLGYKQLIDKNLYLFGEGNYYSYGNKSVNYNYGGGEFDNTNVKVTSYQFLIGVGYKF
jgi:outer membrane immunogenic protein